MSFFELIGLIAVGILSLGLVVFIQSKSQLRCGPRGFCVLVLIIFFAIAALGGAIVEHFGGSPISIFPTLTPSAFSGCYRWNEVTAPLAGKNICVYGIVFNTVSPNNSPTLVLFSNSPDSFYLFDLEHNYPDLRPGMCVRAEGYMQLEGGVPAMNVGATGLETLMPSVPADCEK